MMKRVLTAIAVLLVVGAVAGTTLWAQSTLTIEEVKAEPAYVVVNEPTLVTFTAKIDSPLVIPTGVNLLKVDAGSGSATETTTYKD